MKTDNGTANRQERADKKKKKANKKADAIIAAAVDKIVQAREEVAAGEPITDMPTVSDYVDAALAVEHSTTGTDHTTSEQPKVKRGEASEEDKALGLEVKRLRDGGMAWWLIGYTLGLPGSADNVKQGKSGASRARRLYVLATGGPLPATPRSTASKMPDAYGNGPRPAGTKVRRDVIRRDPSLASMFDEEHTDEDIIKMLRGKKITFENALAGTQETLRVHRTGTAFIHETPSGRCLTFRDASAEDDSSCDKMFRGLPGGTKTVLLSRIVKVAS